YAHGHIAAGLIAPEQLARVWPTVAVWLRRSLEVCPSWHISLTTARARVARRRYGLLVGAVGDCIAGAVLLEHVELRGERLLTVVAAGGERGQALELTGPVLWDAIERIANGLGVDAIRVRGRPGWLRWIHGRGRLREVLIDYEVKHGRR